MLAKGKEREGTDIFVSLTSSMSFILILSYGQVNVKNLLVVLTILWSSGQYNLEGSWIHMYKTSQIEKKKKSARWIRCLKRILHKQLLFLVYLPRNFNKYILWTSKTIRWENVNDLMDQIWKNTTSPYFYVCVCFKYLYCLCPRSRGDYHIIHRIF